MKCPHCLVAIHLNTEWNNCGKDKDFEWFTEKGICPNCGRLILTLVAGYYASGSFITNKTFLVYPKGTSRVPVPSEVPVKFAQDYIEACLVLNDSPKASAALSRRCLQNIIRDVVGIKKSDLSQEIEELLKSNTLPSRLALDVDAVRKIGNFAAHPTKSKSSGEIVDVELGEAEWGLDVLEGLFDLYFVQPAIMKQKRDVLNKKLIDAGKSPLK